MKKRVPSKIPAILFSCMATLLLCCNMAQADEKGLPKRIDDHQILMKHLLDLSSEQVEAIKTIQNSYGKQIAQEQENVHRAREEFNRTTETNEDVATIRLAYAPVAKAMEDMAISHILMKKEINNVLTVEQKKKAKVLRKELFRNKPKHHPFERPDWE